MKRTLEKHDKRKPGKYGKGRDGNYKDEGRNLKREEKMIEVKYG